MQRWAWCVRDACVALEWEPFLKQHKWAAEVVLASSKFPCSGVPAVRTVQTDMNTV